MIQHSGQKIGILESCSRDGGSKLWWVIELCSWVRLIIRGIIVRNFQKEGSQQFSPPEYCKLFALERLMKEGYGHLWTLPSLVTPLFTNSYSASLCPEILMCTSELSGKPDKMVGGGGVELARDCKEKLLITSCYKNWAKSKLDGPLGTHACRLSLQFYTCSNVSNWIVQYVILEHRSWRVNNCQAVNVFDSCFIAEWYCFYSIAPFVGP